MAHSIQDHIDAANRYADKASWFAACAATYARMSGEEFKLAAKQYQHSSAEAYRHAMAHRQVVIMWNVALNFKRKPSDYQQVPVEQRTVGYVHAHNCGVYTAKDALCTCAPYQPLIRRE